MIITGDLGDGSQPELISALTTTIVSEEETVAALSSVSVSQIEPFY